MIPELLLLGLTVAFAPESTAFTNQAAVTDVELTNLGEALWSLDENNVYNLINVNTQGSTTSFGRDNAPKPLLTVQPQAWQGPTISKLIALQDNYIAQVGIKEVVTPQETNEETQFLDAIMTTPVIKKTEQFLIEKGYIAPRRTSPRTNPVGSSNGNNGADSHFRNSLRDIWFGMYSRQNSTLGSSGFEHSFVGEIKNNEVSGFHNWVYFARQEANNQVNYNGHMRILNLGPKGKVMKFNFNWNKTPKPVTTMFVGTSPEFEMAVYTVCFYSRPGVKCPMTFGGKSVPIRTHYLARAGKRYVASAFPEI